MYIYLLLLESFLFSYDFKLLISFHFDLNNSLAFLVGLVVVSSFKFPSSGNVFVSHSFLKDSFARLLVERFFFSFLLAINTYHSTALWVYLSLFCLEFILLLGLVYLCLSSILGCFQPFFPSFFLSFKIEV